MNQKGFMRVVAGVLVVLLGILGYFGFIKKSNPFGKEQVSSPLSVDSSESEIISSLKSNWQNIEVNIPFRPGHPGTVVWGSPGGIQFIGNDSVIVNFEDGYNPGIAVLRIDQDRFKILETFKDKGNFTTEEWIDLVKKYGDISKQVSTYTTSLVRNKEIVTFTELTKVSENIFLKDY